jgi:hypothetical protein
MQVKITVEVDGQRVGEHITEVKGTLAQMEETVTSLGRAVAHKTLQATVDSLSASSPPFRQAASGDSKGMRRGRSLD